MQRIGVFVCHCGSNIAATVDVKKVAEMALHEPGVVHAEDYAYMCSEAGQELIHKAIKEKHLTGLVVCSCSPRMHETTFRNAAERAGLNPYMVEIANIREHCSWIHKDMEEATEKAVILMRAAVAKVNLNAPLKPGESRVTKRALVIGGGIAGIQTALDIAEAGYPVDIVEKTPSIGGRMSQLDKTFPTLDCSSCILTPKMGEVNAHPLINIHTYYTDLTLVRVQGDVVTPVLCQKIMTGGQQLTFNLTEYYMNKLRRVNGDIRGDHASIHMLRNMAEEAKLRVAGNRLPEDAFIFRSPKDHIKYRLRVFREDYEKMVGEIMETIFTYDAKLVEKSAAYGYPAPGTVLLAGGMSECQACVQKAERNYGSTRVIAYKGKSAALLGAAGWLAEKEGAYGMDRSAGQYVQYGTAL